MDNEERYTPTCRGIIGGGLEDVGCLKCVDHSQS